MPATIDPRLASELRIAVMRLSRRLRRERTDDSLTTSQLSALATVERSGTISLGELAALEYVQPPSMTRLVVALEQLQLVRRVRHATDGRQVLLEATDAGRALLAADRQRRDAWLCHRLREVSEDERATLRAAAHIIERLAGS
ncbi:MAG: MarR family transcriptional regulator [Mycobacteriales bacterium]